MAKNGQRQGNLEQNPGLKRAITKKGTKRLDKNLNEPRRSVSN